MSNKSAGNRYFDAGLVIQSKPEIDTNEYGLIEATFSFLTSVSNWPVIQPTRGTPCNEFDYGDSATNTFLAGVSFLGAQTCRWKPGRLSDLACPGTLEVHCQGANFTLAIARRIQTIAIVSGGSGYTGLRPGVIVTGGGEIHPAVIYGLLEVATRSLNAGGTGYVAGDSLTVSGGAFNYPATILVDSVGGGGAISTFHITNRGKYSRTPTNPVSVTGGTGSSATFNLTWRVGFIHVEDPGLYTGTPSVAMASGNAILGEVRMSGDNQSGTLQITEPWKPVSTTKDTIQFTTYGTTNNDPTVTQVKFATTAILGGGNTHYDTTADGHIQIQHSSFGGEILVVDGKPASPGDLILVKDETLTYRNGIYRVMYNGLQVGFPWQLYRADNFDEATAFTTALEVDVQSGNTQAGSVWFCATNVTNLAASDAGGGDAITFNSSAADPTTVPISRVTIDYHAIDLHFEYMANQKLQEPRFVQEVYTMDASRYITTDPDTGEKQYLNIDSILVEDITIDPTTGNTQYTPSNVTASTFDWHGQTKLVGTAARFEQTPAGQYYHIIETTTIKIVPLNASPD